jgi:hypothetical protein
MFWAISSFAGMPKKEGQGEMPKQRRLPKFYSFSYLEGRYRFCCDNPIMPKVVPFVYLKMLSIFKANDYQPFTSRFFWASYHASLKKQRVWPMAKPAA